ncbi:protein kinase apk1a chloroplastic [Phtheirospermum japonicum]|uniref:Protein kinase apk1a chloroplastic n=1 Tax=Phtheirospermum japonicum TaxID=374723 RepID=A0A830DGG7_9LAMI|nr:protein kinase apk1a chloroplastic [Phtheirospermum japonicum]
MGTYSYAAPEYMATETKTARNDVYSFGFVLLEMMTGRRLLDKNLLHREQNLIEWVRPYLASKREVLRVMDARIEGQYSPAGALKVSTVSCTVKLICLT